MSLGPLANCLYGPAAGHTQASAAAVHPDIHSDPTADYRNLGLLQLLKKASRRRGGASIHSTNSAAQHSLLYAQTGQDVPSLGRAQSSLHSHAGWHAPELLTMMPCMHQVTVTTGPCTEDSCNTANMDSRLMQRGQMHEDAHSAKAATIAHSGV